MKKTYLKPGSDMIFIDKIWFMYNDMMGMGKKTRKIHVHERKQGKIPHLVSLQSPRL